MREIAQISTFASRRMQSKTPTNRTCVRSVGVRWPSTLGIAPRRVRRTYTLPLLCQDVNTFFLTSVVIRVLQNRRLAKEGTKGATGWPLEVAAPRVPNLQLRLVMDLAR